MIEEQSGAVECARVPPSCHAPLHAGHPGIPVQKVEAPVANRALGDYWIVRMRGR